MPKVTITYTKPETLKVLKILSKYLDFKISVPKEKSKHTDVLISGDSLLKAKNKSQKSK